jgi:hypothetical protein
MAKVEGDEGGNAEHYQRHFAASLSLPGIPSKTKLKERPSLLSLYPSTYSQYFLGAVGMDGWVGGTSDMVSKLSLERSAST